MTTTRLKFGIPDIELTCGEGMRVNPSTFAGHHLVALFCPTDSERAGREVDAYLQRASEFVASDAWILTFADQCSPAPQERRLMMVADADMRAWKAFGDLTETPERFDRKDGAVFLFTRGGGLQGHWRGAGHVDDVLRALRRPASQPRPES
jgi:hypothetical protein